MQGFEDFVTYIASMMKTLGHTPHQPMVDDSNCMESQIGCVNHNRKVQSHKNGMAQCVWYITFCDLLSSRYRICSKKGPGALSKLIKPGSTFPLVNTLVISSIYSLGTKLCYTITFRSLEQETTRDYLL